MIGISIRAEVEPELRRELMQTCKMWVSDNLPAGCLERRAYEDAMAPTHLLLLEQWSEATAMHAYLSSEGFRALIGAVKVLGKLDDIRICEAKVVESGDSTIKLEQWNR